MRMRMTTTIGVGVLGELTGMFDSHLTFGVWD